jgi:hypothetical protein
MISISDCETVWFITEYIVASIQRAELKQGMMIENWLAMQTRN